MKKLNFFPYYEQLLLSGKKTTTFRESNRECYKIGDVINITIGWEIKESKIISKAEIIDVYEKNIKDLNASDFHGESSDCKSIESTIYVLGAIYRKIFKHDDQIAVVKFKYIS